MRVGRSRVGTFLAILTLASSVVLPTARAEARADGTHVVQEGETLAAIAATSGTDAETLMQLNGIDDPNLIYVGQALTLPTTVGVSAAEAEPAAPAAAPPPPQQYTVAEGDTLAGIAGRLGVDPDTLAQANGLVDPNMLVAGQVLTVPGGAAIVASAPEAPAANEPTTTDEAPAQPPAAATDGATDGEAPAAPSAAPPSGPTRGYLVQEGDTLASIAAQFGTTVEALSASNGLDDANLVLVGETIQVPAPTHQHVVQQGETLAQIAAQEQVDLGTLVDLNGMADPNDITAGQVLLVPAGASAAPPSAAPNPEPLATATPPAEAAAPPDETPAPAETQAPAEQPSATLEPTAEATAAPATDASPAPSATPEPQATPSPSATPSRIYVAAPIPAVATAKPARTTGGGDGSGATPAPTETPRPNAHLKAKKGDLAATGESLLGAPYVWGASGPDVFDCSGFVWYVAQQAKMPVGRGMQQQYDAGKHIKRDKLKRGDIVFFQNTYMPGMSHNGIYLGDDKFLHAADEQDGVTVSSLDDDFWSAHWYGATRLKDPGDD